MEKRKAFTLIELLVVISIIALLLAIMMPALGMVKEKAKNLVCKSNLRSISLACSIYGEEHNGKLMEYRAYQLFLRQLEPYVGNMDEIRYCPSTKINESNTEAGKNGWGSSTEAWWWWLDDTWEEPEFGSYGMNGWMYTYTDSMGYIVGGERGRMWGNLSAVKQASKTPFFVDAIWVDLWPMDTDTIPGTYKLDTGGGGYDAGGGSTGSPGNHIQRCVTDRHNGSVDMAFVDGHTENIKLAELWSVTWNKGWNVQHDVTRTDDTPIDRKR
ncbi:putative major pilin subunit [Anaerohalosphaera lusitana]|uniref:Putative major pilin subunit n=1 Tax=Anaerohalosphaera lusitana TaxID=1936003 RepID=A0A1U9NR41_9BACT|nr:type II secretion system protein [Anaerohalosphaera lusitana]AQT70285.1 putative major pilin subunit [Anaerohalosphaera lusitana]